MQSILIAFSPFINLEYICIILDFPLYEPVVNSLYSCVILAKRDRVITNQIMHVFCSLLISSLFPFTSFREQHFYLERRRSIKYFYLTRYVCHLPVSTIRSTSGCVSLPTLSINID